MTLTVVRDGESGIVRPGDAVFHYDPQDSNWPLHVGIYIGEEQEVSSLMQTLRVRGLPDRSRGKSLGDSEWGSNADYKAHMVGHRKDVDPIHIKGVVLRSDRQMVELSQLGQTCKWMHWDRSYITADGVFGGGTCAQYVEMLYEQAGLDLIVQAATYNPEFPKRIYPATQIHVFFAGAYKLSTKWDVRYANYPECMFGTRSRHK
jgi:hypothetical protein